MHLEHFEDLPFSHGNEGILLWETFLQDGFTTVIEEKIDGSPAVAFGTEGGIPWVGLKSAFNSERTRLYSDEEIRSRFSGNVEIAGALLALLDIVKSKYMPFDRDVKLMADMIFSPQNSRRVVLDSGQWTVATPNVIQYQSDRPEVFESDYTFCVHTVNSGGSRKFFSVDTTQYGEYNTVFFAHPRLWKISIDVNKEKVSLPRFDPAFDEMLRNKNTLVRSTIKSALNAKSREGIDRIGFVELYKQMIESAEVAVSNRKSAHGKEHARKRFDDQIRALVRNRHAVTKVLEFRGRVVRECKEGILQFVEGKAQKSDFPLTCEEPEGIVVRHEVGPPFKMVRRDVFSRQNHEKHMGDK